MPLIKEYIALSGPTNAQNISNAIAEAFSKGATKVLCDKTKPYIAFQRPSTEDEEIKPEGLEIYNIIRQKEILEYDITDIGRTTKEVLLNSFLMLNDRNLFPAYVLIKDKRSLKRVLDLRDSMPLDMLLGAKIYENGEMEEDLVLIAGSPSRTFEPMDIALTIKGYI